PREQTEYQPADDDDSRRRSEIACRTSASIAAFCVGVAFCDSFAIGRALHARRRKHDQVRGDDRRPEGLHQTVAFGVRLQTPDREELRTLRIRVSRGEPRRGSLLEEVSRTGNPEIPLAHPNESSTFDRLRKRSF